MRTLSARVLARAASVSSSASSLSGSQPRMRRDLPLSVGGQVRARVLDLLGAVEHRAVVDPDGVGVLVLDDGAVHERAEVLERLVVQVVGGDPLRDGLGELGGDLVHVGEAVGHRDRQLLAGRALGDAGADRVGERELAAEVVRALGAEIPRSAQTAAIRSSSRQPGAGVPAVAELFLLVDERRAARAGWPAPGCGGSRPRSARGRAAARSGCGRAQAFVPLGAGELVAGLRGEEAALAVVDEHGPVGARAVADAAGSSWPVRHSIPASRSIPSWEISRRALARARSRSSGIRSIRRSIGVSAIVTSNRAGRGSRAGLGFGIWVASFRGWLGSVGARAAVAGGERGDGVGGDVVERLRRVGDHGDPVALDRQRRDPDR